MRYVLFILFWLCLSPFLSALDWIRVDGNRFVNSKGEVQVFRGVNTSDPDKLEKQGQWNARYFQAIADWGCNVIRLPVHPAAWRSRTPEKYLELLDQGIAWASERNLYVIVDWHSIGNLKEEKFQDPRYSTTVHETREFWKTIAGRYRDEPAVAFYELYNEPTVSGERFGTMTWGQWKSIQEEMIRAIRDIDPRTIILVAGFDWAYDLRPVDTDPVAGNNIAYVSHPYPQKREQPWEEKWEADWGFVARKYPVFLTEIGFCLEHERGAHIPVISTEKYGRAITAYTESKGISWVAWVFDTQWSPMLIADWDFTPTTQGRFFKQYLLSKR